MRGFGAGVPVGLLVAERRQQLPVQVVLRRCLFHDFPPSGQAFAAPPGEGLGTAGFQVAHVAEELLAQLRHQAAGVGAQHKVPRRAVEAVVVAPGEGPGDRLELGQVESDGGIGVQAPVYRVGVGIHRRVVVFALVDHLHQFHGVDIGNLIPHQLRVALGQFAHLLGVGAAGDNRHLLVFQGADRLRALLANFVDNLLADFKIRGGEAHLFAALGGYGKAGGRQVSAFLRVAQLLEHLAQVVDIADFQGDAQLLGKGAEHAVFKAGLLARGILVVGDGAILRQHHQLARGLDALQHIRRLAGHQQQGASGQQQALGQAAAVAQDAAFGDDHNSPL